MTFQGIFPIVMISFVLLPLLAEMLMGDPEVQRHFKKGAHYAALLSKIDGTTAVPWVFFSLSPHPMSETLSTNLSSSLSLYLNLTLLLEGKGSMTGK